MGEDLPEVLRVDVGQAAGVDVLSRVRIALQIGVAYTGDAKLVVLVVLAHARERDPVVDLAELAQCARRVLRAQQDAVGIGERQCAAAPGDSLARVVGAVFHHLFWRYIKRHAHRCTTPFAIAS